MAKFIYLPENASNVRGLYFKPDNVLYFEPIINSNLQVCGTVLYFSTQSGMKSFATNVLPSDVQLLLNQDIGQH